MHRYGAHVTRDILGHWLAEQARRGRLVVPDPERCAGMLMDMIFGPLALKHICAEPPPTSEERRSHVRRSIEVFLNGVAPRHETPG
jgi:hypothetical protein